MNSTPNEQSFTQLQVAAFYSFSALDDELISVFPEQLVALAKKYDLRGTVLVGLEGINGTVCGTEIAVQALLDKLEELMLSNPLEVKISWTPKQAFRRFKSRRKDEIVTMGIPGIDPTQSVGIYVEPKDWNEFVDDPHTLLIDTRNEYEIGVGTFYGAVNPHTDTFREFPRWVEKNLKPLINKSSAKRIAMFCTGGIRCEKATSFLKGQGFSEIHHLHGGILRYLEEVPERESRWNGECFVFDQRVALNHKLSKGVHRLCYACGMPLSPEDREEEQYVPGIQCHYCADTFTDEDRVRFAERQKHIDQINERLPGNTIWPSA